jgi:hypothetical protein
LFKYFFIRSIEPLLTFNFIKKTKMKKKLLFLLSLIVLTITCNISAQTVMAVPDGHGGTKIIKSMPPDANVSVKFKNTTINYGKVAYKSNGTKIFYYTNTGTKPLIITNAVSSCGCTVPTWDKKPLKPGGTGKIVVKYDTEREGIFEKHVDVLSNAATNQKITLTIKGEVAAKPKTLLTGGR